VHLRALDSWGARTEPDRVPPPVAGSFKTVAIDAS
jgi:hypothetical protein